MRRLGLCSSVLVLILSGCGSSGDGGTGGTGGAAGTTGKGGAGGAGAKGGASGTGGSAGVSGKGGAGGGSAGASGNAGAGGSAGAGGNAGGSAGAGGNAGAGGGSAGAGGGSAGVGGKAGAGGAAGTGGGAGTSGGAGTTGGAGAGGAGGAAGTTGGAGTTGNAGAGGGSAGAGGAPGDAGLVCGDDTGQGHGDGCNATEANGPCVTPMFISVGSGPTPMGGTIVAGTYDLISDVTYGPADAAHGNTRDLRQTLVFSNVTSSSATLDQVSTSGTAFNRSHGALTFSGTAATFTPTCPAADAGGDTGGSASYSVASSTTGTLFMLIQSKDGQTEVSIFSKAN